MAITKERCLCKIEIDAITGEVKTVERDMILEDGEPIAHDKKLGNIRNKYFPGDAVPPEVDQLVKDCCDKAHTPERASFWDARKAEMLSQDIEIKER